jgi:hypothetical protein
MHFCTYVIIGKRGDPEMSVARALEPFDEGLHVTPYRDYLDPSDIDRMAGHYGIPPTDLPALAGKMEDWRGCQGHVDARGLYALTTYNPDGKWDWYEIGGRWNRYIPGSRDNVISARTLHRSRHLRTCLPYFLLRPDSRWLEQEDSLPFGSPMTAAHRRAARRWLAEVRRVLAEYIDRKVVCVDIHS